MASDLTTEITYTFEELKKIFSSFTNDQINKIPFEGSWTPGQVGEHIVKSIGNLPQFLNEKTEQALRQPDEKAGALKELFLNFTVKMNSPEFIIPLDPVHDKDSLLASFSVLKQQMTEAAETLDLTMTCKSFEFPGFGFLTRMEWLIFFLAHTQRHTHQLKNIYSVMNP